MSRLSRTRNASQDSNISQARSFSSFPVNEATRSSSSTDFLMFATRATTSTFIGAVRRSERPTAKQKLSPISISTSARSQIPNTITAEMFSDKPKIKIEIMKKFAFDSKLSCVKRNHSNSTFANTFNEIVSDQVRKEVFWAVLPPQETTKAQYSFITGQRGAPKILYDGFSYICAKQCNDRKYWVCAKQRSRNCKARLITARNGRLEVSKNVYHNHGPENSNPGTTKCYIETLQDSDHSK